MVTAVNSVCHKGEVIFRVTVGNCCPLPKIRTDLPLSNPLVIYEEWAGRWGGGVALTNQSMRKRGEKEYLLGSKPFCWVLYKRDA